MLGRAIASTLAAPPAARAELFERLVLEIATLTPSTPRCASTSRAEPLRRARGINWA